MSIRENIKAVRKKVLMEVGEDNKAFTSHLQDLATAAIRAGMRNGDATTPEWKEYMALFAAPDRPDQLARLTGEDGTHNEQNLNTARTYLVADAKCGTETSTNFGKGASVVLDQDLAP